MADSTKPVSPNAPAPAAPLKPMKFIHEKGSQYRVFHADGTWGSINAHGNVQLDFYIEHPIAPSAVILPVKDGAFTGEHILQGVDDPVNFVVTRDFQCGIILSFQAAMHLQAVLDSFIESTKKQMAQAYEVAQKSK